MHVLRTPPVIGLLLGALAALVFVVIVTAIAGSNGKIWWWPAVAVAGAIGGGVLGSLFGTESEGESPDEAYDDESAREV
jgi:hypothetical protein